MAIRIPIKTVGGTQTEADLDRLGNTGERALDRIRRGSAPASKGLLAVNDASRRVRGQMRDMAASAGPAGRVLSALGPAGFAAAAGIGAVIVGSAGLARLSGDFATFERGLIGVGKTTNISGRDLENLGARVQGLTRELPVATAELLDIAQAAGQLGVNGANNILIFTETVGKLGLTTDLVGDQAATAMARILTVTGTPIAQVDRLGAAVVGLGNNFAATESEIVSAATRVAQATALFGTSAADTVGIGAALRATGVEAEAGGTVIGKAFQAINAAVRQGGEEMAVFQQITGLTQAELRKLFQEDSAKAFQVFVEGLGRVKAAGGDVSAVIEQVGLDGVRSNQVLGTMATRSEVLAEALNRANTEFESNTALTNEALVAATSFSAQMTVVGNVANEASVSLGRVIAPTLIDGARTFGDAMGYVADNMDTLQTIAGTATAAVGGRLTVAVVASTAASIRERAATLAAAEAHVAKTASVLAGARAQVLMAANMAVGTERTAALAAAATAATAAHNAHAAAITRVTAAARIGAGAMGTLRASMAFLGGPWGVAITAIAGAYYYLSSETGEAAKAQDEYRKALEKANPATAKSIQLSKDAAIAKTQEAIQTKIAAQALIQSQIAEIQARIASSGQPASELFDIKPLEKLGRAYGLLQKDIESLIVKATAPATRQQKKLKSEITSTGDASDEAKKELKEYESRLASLIDTLDPVGKKTRDYMQSVADLDRAWIAGKISGEEHDELMQRLATDVKAVADAEEEAAKAAEKAAKEREKLAEKAAAEGQKIFDNAAEGVQDAFTDAFENIYGGGVNTFSELRDTIKSVFVRLAAEITTLLVFRPVVNSIAGAAGIGGFSGGANASPIANIGSALSGSGGVGFNPLQAASSFLGPAGSVLGIGALGGGLIASATGGNQLGGSLGGAAGAYGGVLLGSGVLGGATSALVGALGNLGNFVIPGLGLILGALAGSLLGNKKPTNASAFGGIDLAAGTGGQNQHEDNSTEDTRKARDAIVDAVLGIREGIITATGGSLSGSIGLDVGQRDGVQVTGIGAGKYGTPEQAVQGIFRGMLNNLQGVDDELRAVFSRIDTSDLDQAVKDLGLAASIINEDFVIAEPLNEAVQAIKAINDAFDDLVENAQRLGLGDSAINAERARQIAELTTGFESGISDAILAIVDPVALALKQHEIVAQERLDNARELGADLVEVERLNALERQNILESSGPNKQIKDFLTGLASGPGSFLSSTDRLENARQAFADTLASANAGSASARNDITGVASNLITASRDQFGSGEQFFQQLDVIESALYGLIGQDGTSAALNDIGATIATGNSAMVDELQRLNTQVSELTQALADQQAVLDRLVLA